MLACGAEHVQLRRHRSHSGPNATPVSAPRCPSRSRGSRGRSPMTGRPSAIRSSRPLSPGAARKRFSVYELRDGSLKSAAGPRSCNWWKSAAMASTLPSSNLIELYDTEHLGVTGHGKSQPQQYPGRENQSAKGSRNYFNVGSLALVCHSIGNTGLPPGGIGTH